MRWARQSKDSGGLFDGSSLRASASFSREQWKFGVSFGTPKENFSTTQYGGESQL